MPTYIEGKSPWPTILDKHQQTEIDEQSVRVTIIDIDGFVVSYECLLDQAGNPNFPEGFLIIDS